MPRTTTREAMMRRAVALSRRGYPAPNPRVGCVVARGDEIVGEGWHAVAGGPHAEVVALAAAGTRARGATVYVTLEPCNHHGRTGPCSHALRDAGVAHVVAAVLDPNPKAAGGGTFLEDAGIGFESGVLAAEAEQANHQWLQAMRAQRPFTVVKAGASLDGRIALPSGESRWITGPAARRDAHRVRAEMGAVLVGRRTVALDDPELTARIRGVRRQPLRIVLDPRSTLRGDERIFGPEAETVRFTAQEPRTPHDVRLEAPNGQFDPNDVLRALWGRGITGVLVEGGAATSMAFLEAGLVDRIELYLAPVLLGAGPSWIEGALCAELAGAPRWTLQRVRRVGPDVRLTLVPEER